MIAVIHWLLIVYTIILFVRILSSWVRVPAYGVAGKVLQIVYDLTEPVLRPLRSILPPIRMGAMAMDLSPIIVFIVLDVLIAYTR